MDASGKWIIQPEYYSIGLVAGKFYQARKTPFRESLKYFPGYISIFDLAGKPVDFGLPKFSGIVSVVSTEDPIKFSFASGSGPNAGVIDSYGHVLIEPLYNRVFSFRDGIYVVHNWGEDTFSFLNTDGRHLAKVNNFFWPSQDGFCEGVLLCKANTEQVYLRPNSTQLSLPNLKNARSFSSGFASVQFASDSERSAKDCFIDKNGTILANRKFDYSESFENKRAIVGIKDPVSLKLLKGLIDLNGTYLVRPIWDDLETNDVSTYVARINGGINTTGGDVLIDASGTVVSRYGDHLRITPGSVVPQMAYRENKLGGFPKSGQLVGIDRCGNIFDCKHWPVADVIAPVTDDSITNGSAGLRDSKGWVTKPIYRFIEALPGRRWVVEAPPVVDPTTAKATSKTLQISDPTVLKAVSKTLK